PQDLSSPDQTVDPSSHDYNHGHGHSHSHSGSCKHAHGGPRMNNFMRATQPISTVPPKLPPSTEMKIVQAVQYGEIERCKQLIESGQADVNSPDEEG
ncbi:unnamed protein product, partial [Didymodactylos carnosus]